MPRLAHSIPETHVIADGARLAEIVADRRAALQLPQLAVAIDSAVTPSTMANIEGKRVDPKFSNVLRVVRALGGRIVVEWQEISP